MWVKKGRTLKIGGWVDGGRWRVKWRVGGGCSIVKTHTHWLLGADADKPQKKVLFSKSFVVVHTRG